MDQVNIEPGKSLRVPFFTFTMTIVNDSDAPFSAQVTHSDLVEPYITIRKPNSVITSEQSKEIKG